MDEGRIAPPMREEARRSTVRRLLRPQPNRKLRQRRPLRAVVPSAGEVAAVAWRGLRRAAALLLAVTGAVAVGVGTVLLHHFVTHSPRFAVADIEVRGNVRVSAEEIRRRAGVAPGTNL